MLYKYMKSQFATYSEYSNLEGNKVIQSVYRLNSEKTEYVILTEYKN